MYGGSGGYDDAPKVYKPKIKSDAQHTIFFKFCGSWGFKDHVDKTIEKINST